MVENNPKNSNNLNNQTVQDQNPNTGSNANNSPNNPTNQGNVVRPQQQNTQNNTKTPINAVNKSNSNASNVPVNNKTSNPSKKFQTKKSSDDMSSYEKRFRDFIKRRFGGLIGDMLLDSEMSKLNIQDMSLLDDSNQIDIMNKVLNDIFEKHEMQDAKEQTRVEMYIQLCLDEAGNQISQKLNDKANIGFVDVVHKNEKIIENYSPDNTEKTYWIISGNTEGDIQTQIKILVPERESMMLMTEYCKNNEITFNPTDEKQKEEILFDLVTVIFGSIIDVADKIMQKNISFNLNEFASLDVDVIDKFKKAIDNFDKEKGSRPDIISLKLTIELGAMKYEILLLALI